MTRDFVGELLRDSPRGRHVQTVPLLPRMEAKLENSWHTSDILDIFEKERDQEDEIFHDAQ